MPSINFQFGGLGDFPRYRDLAKGSGLPDFPSFWWIDGSKLHTIYRISPDGTDEFLSWALYEVISQDNAGQRQRESESLCGIVIRHFMPEYWYNIWWQILHSLQVIARPQGDLREVNSWFVSMLCCSTKRIQTCDIVMPKASYPNTISA